MWVLLLACLVVAMPGDKGEHRRFYRLFGSTDSVPQLRRQFRQLALQYHPDKAVRAGKDQKTAEKDFALLTTAYERLVKKVERRAHTTERDREYQRERSRVTEELRKAREQMQYFRYSAERDEEPAGRTEGEDFGFNFADEDDEGEEEEEEEEETWAPPPPPPRPKPQPKHEDPEEAYRRHLKMQREQERMWTPPSPPPKTEPQPKQYGPEEARWRRSKTEEELKRMLKESSAMETLFLICFSSATVLGIAIMYYCIALKDEVEEVQRLRAAAAAEKSSGDDKNSDASNHPPGRPASVRRHFVQPGARQQLVTHARYEPAPQERSFASPEWHEEKDVDLLHCTPEIAPMPMPVAAVAQPPAAREPGRRSARSRKSEPQMRPKSPRKSPRRKKQRSRSPIRKDQIVKRLRKGAENDIEDIERHDQTTAPGGPKKRQKL